MNNSVRLLVMGGAVAALALLAPACSDDEGDGTGGASGTGGKSGSGGKGGSGTGGSGTGGSGTGGSGTGGSGTGGSGTGGSGTGGSGTGGSGTGGASGGAAGGGGDAGMGGQAGADAAAALPTCEAFCTRNRTVCTGTPNERYATQGACTTACDGWTKGTSGASTGNTLACRDYHTTAAAASATAATTHCPHTGTTATEFCL